MVQGEYLFAITCTFDQGQTEFRAEYDAWGRQNVVTDDLAHFQRGYCGHEHWHEFDLIDMNGRMYDPVISRFLSPDPFVQAPEDLQNYNRYSYCLNNPLKYTDPSGESVLLAAIAGAVVGTYLGGAMANKSYNPVKWNNTIDTWKNMFWGSVVGFISGAWGASVAASGMPFANAAGIVMSSACNSIGTGLYTNGQTPFSMSFGIASYDFTNDEWGWYGKNGNSGLENLGYFMGALVYIQDFTTAIRGDAKSINVNSASTRDDWWGHSSITEVSETNDRLVSVGPPKDDLVAKTSSLKETWQNSIKKANTEWPTYVNDKGTWSVQLDNVSTEAIRKYTSNISRWDLLLNSCVGHTTRALWSAGIPTIYAFHPHALNAQLALRQIGIYASPYIYQAF
ncbi:MAG: RHS repeat-associated core domain-containing protein [Bacteroidales bacterium]|nr:RHS repeat-associated core domain-containing protein [Bacteroidales bacterium]